MKALRSWDSFSNKLQFYRFLLVIAHLIKINEIYNFKFTLKKKIKIYLLTQITRVLRVFFIGFNTPLEWRLTTLALDLVNR